MAIMMFGLELKEFRAKAPTFWSEVEGILYSNFKISSDEAIKVGNAVAELEVTINFIEKSFSKISTQQKTALNLESGFHSSKIRIIFQPSSQRFF